MYSCCASGFTRERNTVTIIIALPRKISPRRASATDTFASWQTVPLRPHHGGRFLLGSNVAFSGAPLWAHLLQGFVGRQRASRFPMSWTLACALRRHVDSSQRHGTKSAKAFLAVALSHNFHICNRHCLPDLYCLGLRDDGLSVSRRQKVNVEIDRNCDASCGQRSRD